MNKAEKFLKDNGIPNHSVWVRGVRKYVLAEVLTLYIEELQTKPKKTWKRGSARLRKYPLLRLSGEPIQRAYKLAGC